MFSSGPTKYVTKGDESGVLSFEQKNLSSTSNPDGGYLVPKRLSDKILYQIKTDSPIRRLAATTVISTDAIELLREKQGASAGWTTETGDRPTTDTPSLHKIRIPVHEMYAKPRATQKLLDDSHINIEHWLQEKVSQQFTALENKAFLFGDGKGKPKGILRHDISYDDEDAWGKLQGLHIKNSKDITGDALIKLIYKLKAYYLQGASWVMSRNMLSILRQLKDTSGQYLWNPGLNGRQESTLLGYPVIICDDMATTDAEDRSGAFVLFGNFKEGYQIVDHSSTRVLRDPYSAKPYVEFYATRRVGGDITNFEAFSVLTCDQ